MYWYKIDQLRHSQKIDTALLTTIGPVTTDVHLPAIATLLILFLMKEVWPTDQVENATEYKTYCTTNYTNELFFVFFFS